MRDLFAEGALSAAFVTTFTKKIETEGEGAAWALARKVATLAAVFMSGMVLLGIAAAPWVIRFMTPFWDPGGKEVALTVVLVRIMFPFIAVVSMSALVMGMLNAKGRFFVPALASSFFNIGSIATGFFLGRALDPAFGERALMCFAAGTLVGGLLQLGVQLPPLWRTGFRFRPEFGWRDPGVRKVLALMGPAVVAGSAVQVNVMLNNMFASSLYEGAITYLGFAFRLMQLPLGVFGVAVAMVTLPAVSRAAANGLTPEFGVILGKAMRMVVFLTLPSAVGLAVLADPVVSVVYERGRLSPEDAHQTALALRAYAAGLVFYAGIKVVQPAFYAIDRRFVPMFVSFGAIGINVVLNSIFLFVLGLGHEFLALSTSVGAVANFTVLFLLMRKHAGGAGERELAAALAKLAVAVAALVAVCLAGQQTVLAGWTGLSQWARVAALGGTIAAAAAAYFTATALLKVAEAREFLALLKSRRKQ
jgi:putative peptidoglycan lipid II flippase